LEELYRFTDDDGVDDRELDIHGGYDSEDDEDLYNDEDNDRYHRVI
jgi:hypothetical protein